ncbi:MAG: hypothetical protein ABIH41_06485 [Nanoarchaeota archaeon]
MSESGFSRIREIFYEDIGSPTHRVNMQGFLHHTFDQYFERYMQGNRSGPPRNAIYPGNTLDDQLILRVGDCRGRPDLIGMELRSSTNTLDVLLMFLDGTLKAVFDNTAIDALPAYLADRLRKARREDQAYTDGLLFTFKRNQETSDTIIAAETAKEHIALRGRAYTSTTMDAIRDNEPIMSMLAGAARIQIQSNHHINGDENDETILQECHISHPPQGPYRFEYMTWNASQHALPADSYDQLDALVRIVKGRFDRRTYKRMHMEAPNPRVLTPQEEP